MDPNRDKALKLINLAMDGSATNDERAVAAIRAVKIIRKYKLLDSPLDGLLGSDNEVVGAAASIIDKLTDPDLVRGVKTLAGKLGRRRRR